MDGCKSAVIIIWLKMEQCRVILSFLRKFKGFLRLIIQKSSHLLLL